MSVTCDVRRRTSGSSPKYWEILPLFLDAYERPMNSNREAAVGIQELCIDRSIDDTNKGDRAERLGTLYGIISTKFNILMYNKEKIKDA